MLKVSYVSILLFLLVGLGGLMLSPTYAQLPATNPAQPTEGQTEHEWPQDSLQRRTPRGTVAGFVKAVAEQNYVRAARYLNLSDLADPIGPGTEMAQTLERLVDRQGNIISRVLISDDYDGRTGDDLPPNLDRIGVINTNNEPLPIYLERTEDPDGAPLWLFSAETLRALPAITDTDSALAVNRYLPGFLLTNKWGGVPIGHWLVIVFFMGLAYLLAWGLVATPG